MIGENLLRYKRNQKYLVFDFETESLNLHFSRPWQLYFMLCEGKEIKEKHNYYLYWSDLNISQDALRITKIDIQTIKNKSTNLGEALEHFESYLYNDDYLIVGHNLLGFDIYQHNNFRRNLNRQTDYSYVPRILDTLSIARAYHLYENGDLASNVVPNSTMERITWMYKYLHFRKRGMKTSLGVLGKKFECKFDMMNLHDASVDIPLNFEVFTHLVGKMEL